MFWVKFAQIIVFAPQSGFGVLPAMILARFDQNHLILAKAIDLDFGHNLGGGLLTAGLRVAPFLGLYWRILQ